MLEQNRRENELRAVKRLSRLHKRKEPYRAAQALDISTDQPAPFGGFTNAVSNLLDIFVMPFYVTAVVLYYFDLRVRKEKYDFEVVH